MSQTIDSLQIEISSSGESAAKGLESLRGTLETFKTAIKGGLGLRAVANNVGRIASASNSAQTAATGLGALANSLGLLRNVTNGMRISPTIGRQITSISDAVRGADLTGLREFTAAMRPLGELGRSNLSSYTTQLARIPDIVNALDSGTLRAFADITQRLTTALRPLSEQLDRVGTAFSRFPQRVRAATRSTQAIPQANGAAVQSYKDLSSLLHDAANGMRKTASQIAGWIKESNEYVENLNLFTVALGEYAGKAQRYADRVASIMGIDPSEWMRNQGVFFTLADGFGVVGDRAYLMSKNLTQLGYDISSFFNIPIEESMQKLQSGISGEIEPLRRLGYDLSQTRLEAVAATLGIKQSVSDMTQAEKAQLRYYAVMTQVTTAQGDMARTLNSPANQLRILSASATQAARALGNIFIPIMNKVLPVAIAVAKAVRMVAVSIASLFGYSLPSIDFSATSDSIGGVSDGMDNVADSADKAGGSAKKLKSILMGFDEINQMPDASSGGGGGGGSGSGGGVLDGFDFELPEYDFLANMVSNQVDAIYRKVEPFVTWISDHITGLLASVSAVGGAFLSWKLAKSMIPDLSKGWKLLGDIKGLAVSLATIGIMVALVYTFDTQFAETGRPGLLIADGLSTLLSSAIVGRIVQKTFGGGALYGASVTLGISAITTIGVMGATVRDEGLNGRAVALGITALVKSALSGAAFGYKVGGVKGAIGGAVFGLGLTVAVEIAAVLNGIQHNNIRKSIKWGEVEIEAEKVRAYAEDLFDIDVASNINVITSTLDNESDARAALNSTLTRFEATLKALQVGVEVDTSTDTLTALQVQASKLIEETTALLQSQRETVAVAMSLVPATDAEGNDISAGVLESFLNANSTLTAGVQDLGARLSAAIADGMADGMSDEEQRIITELSAALGRISRAVETGEARGAFAAKTELLLSDLTQETFSSVLDEYNAVRAELEESYRNIETQAHANVQGQIAGLSEYLKTIDRASDPSKYDGVAQQIETLKTQLDGWNLGESVADSMEAALAPVRKRWQDALNKIYAAPLQNLDTFSVDMSAFTRNWITNLQEGMDFSEFELAFENKLVDVFVNAFGGDAENAIAMLNMADSVGLTGWDMLGAEIQTQFYSMMVDATSKEEVDALFTQLGYSIPGAVKEGMDSAGGMVVTPVADTTEFEAALASAATTAGATGDAVAGIGTDFSGMSSTAKTELTNVEKAASSATDTIAATGAQADSLGTKIVEIPTEKVIAIEISNYTTIIRNLNNIADKIAKLSSKTINLKVKAGLTAGAKTFLNALTKIDATLTNQVNAVLNASQFAGGGYPRSGELFIANEAGAEMVGRIGNRTAVANQDQIGDAIFRYMDAHSEGNGMDEDRLAYAIVSAMRAAGLGTVNIDGRMIAQAINRESQRMGKPAV